MKGSLKFQSEMKELRFTERQKQELIRQLQNAPKETPVLSKTPRMVRTLLVAAVLCAALSLTVVAFGEAGSAAEVFENLFALNGKKTEIVNKIGRPVGASDTHDGLTVTADAIMGDRHNVCIVYTLSAEDGTPLDKAEDGETLSLSFGTPGTLGSASVSMGTHEGGHGNCEFKDFVPGDGKMQYVEYISTNQQMDLAKGKVKTHFKNLYVQSLDEWVLFKKGDWKLEFALCYEDLSVELSQDQNKEFVWEDVSGQVKTLQISPLGIYAEYETELSFSPTAVDTLTEKEKKQMLEQMEQQYQVPIQIKKKDGTLLDGKDMGLGGSFVTGSEKTICIRSGNFDDILPMEEIESVSIGSAVYLMP